VDKDANIDHHLAHARPYPPLVQLIWHITTNTPSTSHGPTGTGIQLQGCMTNKHGPASFMT